MHPWEGIRVSGHEAVTPPWEPGAGCTHWKLWGSRSRLIEFNLQPGVSRRIAALPRMGLCTRRFYCLLSFFSKPIGVPNETPAQALFRARIGSKYRPGELGADLALKSVFPTSPYISMISGTVYRPLS